MVFDGVICSGVKHPGDLFPLGSVDTMRLEDDFFLLRSPFRFIDFRVKMIVPSTLWE